MIVEFTGPPAGGKTTIASALACLVKGEGLYVAEPKRKLLDDYKMSFVRRVPFGEAVVCDLILYWLFLRNMRSHRKAFVPLIGCVMRARQSLFHKVNIIRNLIKKFALDHYLRSRRQDCVFLVDEGLSHIPFNICVDASGRFINSGEITALSASCGRPDFTIFVQASVATVRKRLKERGHRRIDCSDEAASIRFVESCEDICRQLKAQYSDDSSVITVYNDASAPVEPLVRVIKCELDRMMSANRCEDWENRHVSDSLRNAEVAGIA